MCIYDFRKSLFAVAPMLGWTDRHCRFFHRQLAPHALLYTEMIHAEALLHGNKNLILFHEEEHPLALQLGGSDPSKLAQVACLAADLGYDEINLNVGCPSERVQLGAFGACLMYTPDLLGACVRALRNAVSIPITVKCRIGVDEQDVNSALDSVADSVFSSGGDALWVHARKAWLKGLSAKENRTVPPLDYDRVYRLKEKYPDKFIGINGGVGSVSEVKEHLSKVDGVMLGRAAYHTPELLFDIHSHLQSGVMGSLDYHALFKKMFKYSTQHISTGGKLSHITRHMVGLFHGFSGSGAYRRILSTDTHHNSVDPELLYSAFSCISFEKKDML